MEVMSTTSVLFALTNAKNAILMDNVLNAIVLVISEL